MASRAATIPPEWATQFRVLGGLAGPLIIVHLGQQTMGLVDTALAGRIDQVALAATGLGNTVFMLGVIFGVGLVMGVDPLASQAFGAGNRTRARQAARHGIYAALIISLPIAAAIAAMAGLLEYAGISHDLAAETRSYIWGRLGSIAFFLITMAQRSYLQADHRVRPIVLAAVAANIFNFAADWTLVFGDAGLLRLGLPEIGLPSFGVMGIGWATTVATLTQAVVLGLAWRATDSLDQRTAPDAFDPRLLRFVFRVGAPIGAQLLAELGIFGLVGVLAGTLGSAAMAAHQVALMYAAFTFMVPLAIAAATSVEVGRAIGRRDAAGTRRAGLAGLIFAGLVGSLTATLMWVFPRPLASLLTDQSEVIPLAAQLIAIAGIFQVFDCVQAVSSGALRGAGLARWALAGNLVAYWVAAFPIAVWLGFVRAWGTHGLWWGLTGGLAVAAVILTAKFLQVSAKPIAAIDSSG